MSRAPSFAGVILAAGASSRMGRDKALLPWHGGTFLSAAIQSLASSTDMVIVVAGANAERLRPVAYALGAFVVVNPEPERGQFSSLRVGLNEVLNRGRDSAMVTLVDRPAATAQTVALLRDAFVRGVAREGGALTGMAGQFAHASDALWAVVPEYEGKHGHPYVAGREMIEAFLRAPAGSTAREVEHAHQANVAYVAVSDANVVANVDTPEEYAGLIGS